MTAGLLLLLLATSSCDTDRDPPPARRSLALLQKAIRKQPNPAALAWEDHVLRFTSSTLIVADWLTTIDAMRKGYAETNPLLGRHPSLGRVNVMIGAGVLMNTFLIPKIEKPELRRGLWFAIFIAELNALRINRDAGLRFNFAF
jgi:hypothetical protein